MANEGHSNAAPARIRLGMVGGGQGAFIGGVHRIASRIDDHFELVAGALSSDPDRAKASGAELGLADDRSYGTYLDMAKREARLKNGIEAVSIVTPNNMHFPVAREFLKRGIHVICDKPLTSNLADAKKLAALVEKTGTVFVLTHNYTGYPMVRQARQMIASGELGSIRVIQAEYPQDWLSADLETTGQKQAAWRTDPAQAGAGGSTGDIGTHAYNLACFITGLGVEELSADLSTFVGGRQLDDNAHVMLRFSGGARGMLWSSQVAPGNENALAIRIYGSKGGLEWKQEDPNYLWFTPLGEPKRLITRAGAGSGDGAGRVTRIPPRPSGRLSGGLRQHLHRGRALHSSRAGRQQSGSRNDFSNRSGWRQRRCVRRCLCPLQRPKRCMDQTGLGMQASRPLCETSIPPDWCKNSGRFRSVSFGRLFAVGFESLPNVRHLGIVEDHRRAQLAGGEILSAQGLDLDGQTKRRSQIHAKTDHAMIGQKTGGTPFQRGQHVVRQFRRAERCVVRTSKRITARRRHHVVERGNILSQAGKRRRMRRVRVNDSLGLVPRRINVEMHAPFGRWQEVSPVPSLQIHIDDMHLFHLIVGNSRGCDDKPVAGSGANITGRALIEPRFVHLHAGRNDVPFQRWLAMRFHESATAPVLGHSAVMSTLTTMTSAIVSRNKRRKEPE